MLSSPATAQPQGSPLTEADRAAFAELDRLHTPDLKDLPLVRAAIGGWSRHGNAPPEAHTVVAFLVAEEGKRFTVWQLDHSTASYETSPPDTPEHERIGFERLDLAAHVATVLAASRDAKRRSMAFGPWHTPALGLATLARACAARGLDVLAHDLCEAAREGIETPLADAVRKDLSLLGMWRNVLAFGEPDVTYAQLRDRFQAYRSDFPDGEYAKRAREMLDLLEAMLTEVPPTGEAIERLVFDLRDQNGQQWSQPGWCDVFADPRGEESSAHRLAEAGWAAVPRLIGALGDDRFTRSVGFHRDFYFSHQVLRVGECATAILHRITGQVWKGSGAQGTARAWWRTVEAGGERAFLVECVEAGNVPALARRLVARYPAAAPAAVLRGLRASEGQPREEYLDLVAALEGGEARMAVEQEIRNGPDLGARLRAAKLLWERGRIESVAIMVEEWKKADLDLRDHRFHLQKLAEFLGGCGDSRALDALRARYDALAVDFAIDVVGGLLHEGFFGSRRKVGLDAATLGALERLLLVAIEDERIQHGLSMGRGKHHWTDPRVCDVAGAVLALRFPDRYSFDHEAPRAARDRQRIAILNVGRKERGEPQLPVSTRRLPEPAPATVTGPLLDAMVSGEDRDGALAKLRDLGLGAMDAVLRRLESLAPAAREETGLADLARRIATTVAVVEVKEGSVEPGESLRTRLDVLKGAELTGPRLADLLVHLTNHLPGGSTGFVIAADREAARGGFRVVVTFLPGPVAPSDDGSPGWGTSIRVDAGEVQEGSYGSSSDRYGRSRDAWDDLVEVWNQAVAQDPETPIELVVRKRKEG